MAQANVYTSAANAVWYTDKASISTGNTAVTFNVYAPAVPVESTTIGVLIIVSIACQTVFANLT